jgi:hypothetical protein
MTPAERTPVLIGIGLASCREDDPTRALEPMDLMHTAVAAAGRDAGHAAALSGVGPIAIRPVRSPRVSAPRMPPRS